MSSPVRQLRVRVPHIAQEAVDRARLTVVPRTRRRAPKVPFIALVTLVLMGGVVGLLMFNTSMQQASFTAASLERQATALAELEQSLDAELEGLRDPQRIAQQAQAMGMVVPRSPSFLSLSDGDITGPAVPASAEDGVTLHGRAPAKPEVLQPRRTVVTETDQPDARGASADAGAESRHDRRGRD
jgi:hypothetical protein